MPIAADPSAAGWGPIGIPLPHFGGQYPLPTLPPPGLHPSVYAPFGPRFRPVPIRPPVLHPAALAAHAALRAHFRY
jgi:hypothetical protein